MPMNVKNLNETIRLARAVIKLAEEVKDGIVSEKRYNPQTRQNESRYPTSLPPSATPYSGTRLTGRLRRRSHDLSEQLVELRRS